MNTRISLTLALALLAGACSASTPVGVVDNGGAPGGGGSTGTAGTTGTPGTTDAGVPGNGTTATAGSNGGVPPGHYVPSGDQVLNDPPFTNPSGISGDWVGYVENGTPGSEEVLLRFGTDAQGQTTLTLKRGTAMLPPPPTDRLQVWPPGPVEPDGAPVLPNLSLLGFTSTAHGVAWTGSRLRFRTAQEEPWGPWCALQISYLVGKPPIYTCIAPSDLDDQGNVGDLGHLVMCVAPGICACNATGCGFNVLPSISYDITFFGDHALGEEMQIGGSKVSLILMPAAP